MKETRQGDRPETAVSAGISRRRFFGLAGGIAGAGLLFGAAGCKKSDDDGVYLGTGDTGILNFAFALEQLEAAFYTKLIQQPFNGITADERNRLSEIRDHEIAHREFFKTVLGASAIANLEFNFTSINFADRASTLGAAKAFEDLGVSAYNGAAQLFSDATNLMLASKIVSVEARHAAFIRDTLQNGTFTGSDILDGNGLEKSRTPSQVLSIVSAYIYTKIDASGLPTN